MFWPFCDLPAGFHILRFRILNPWEIWTFWIFEDFESWGFLILRNFDPEDFLSLKYWKSPQLLMLLVNHILTHVLFIFNFRYYDNHFLVCGTCWIKSIWFFSFVFAAPPVISRRSHTLRRRAVGQIFPHGQELWSQGALEENLIPCEQVSWERNCCQGDLASIRMNEHFASPGIRCWNSWEISLYNLICHSFRWILVRQYLCNSEILKDSYCKEGSPV